MLHQIRSWCRGSRCRSFQARQDFIVLAQFVTNVTQERRHITIVIVVVGGDCAHGTIQHSHGRRSSGHGGTLHGPHQFLEFSGVLQPCQGEFVRTFRTTRRVNVDAVQRVGNAETRVTGRFDDVAIGYFVKGNL